MKFPAWYGILVGVLMVAQWTLSIISGGVPEFQTAPWEIAFHLAAELSTALMLVIGGIASLRSLHWAWSSTARSSALDILLNSVNGRWS